MQGFKELEIGILFCTIVFAFIADFDAFLRFLHDSVDL